MHSFFFILHSNFYIFNKFLLHVMKYLNNAKCHRNSESMSALTDFCRLYLNHAFVERERACSVLFYYQTTWWILLLGN